MFKSTLKIIIGLCLFAYTGFSQVTTSAISGTVADTKGEGLPGATVLAIHTPTGARYGTVTNPLGRFSLQNMRVGGPYKISITYIGYKEDVKSDVYLSLGQELRINSKLSSVDSQLEEVKIVASRSSVINAGRTGAATTIGNNSIRTLPTLNRSLSDFGRFDPRSNTNNNLSFAGRSANFNNITVDGAFFNNAFGLNNTIGGQASAQPISVDAIDQFQINIAPFDVRQGMSTGANINVVTKGGTNEWSGSVYSFNRNENMVGNKVNGTISPILQFGVTQFGGRIGGPIIKDKVFIFASFEKENRTDPGTTFRATRDGDVAGSAGLSAAKASDLDKLKSFLITKYNYDPGAYENYDKLTQSTKFNARLDWNISDKHKLNIKYNTLRSFADISASNSGAIANNRQPSNTNLPFQGGLYRINNNLDSYIAELNSTFGKFANNLTVGYTQMRDFRESPVNSTPFPTVDIGNGAGQSFTSFGYEPFSANNLLDSDIFQISDNLTYFLGKHTFTLGVAYEDNSFKNGFAPDYYGGYQFASLQGFLDNANGVAGAPNPLVYRVRWSNTGDFPFAKMKGNTTSIYAQDEINVAKGFKLTLGLRLDGTSLPIEKGPTTTNSYVPALTFRNGVKLATDQFPSFTSLLSPRLGFNWDVNEERKTQIRGGIGIFSGRVPYVWLSNQLSNNGVLFSSISTNNPTNRPFTPDVNAYRPAADIANFKPISYNLAVTDGSFKFPQVLRANLAIDKTIGEGWLVALEALYTKDINAVYMENVNLPNATMNAIGADNRPIFFNKNATTGFPTTAYNRIYGAVAPTGGYTAENPNISDAILMKNTDKGYSYTLTGTISKSFTSGFFASLSYNYTDSRSVNDGGSIAQSIWRDRSVSGDPNEDVLSYSSFLQSHRIVGYGSYKLDYADKKAATTFGFGLTVGPGSRFSYIYTGDMNGDGLNANDLIYIPRDQSEISLRDIAATTSTPLYTAAQQWADLNAYISQDPYLSGRRGQYAERNGAVSPWSTSIDFKIIQDFNFKIGNKVNTFQITFDLFNTGNYLLNSWGNVQGPNRAALLTFQGYNATTGKPEFTYPFQTGAKALTTSYQDLLNESSRWRGQLGIRYIFN